MLANIGSSVLTPSPSSLLALAAVAALAGPAAAADAPAPPTTRNEIVVFGGISLLDADGNGRTLTLPAGGDVPNALGFGGRFRLPLPLPPVSLTTRSGVGSSGLFGARYSRAIKDRLGLEADLAVAPAHSLETRGSGCVGDLCFESGRAARIDGGVGRGFGDREVTAWQYGAGLAYEITQGDVQPLVILGAGAVTWNGAQGAGTDFELRFGAGLKVYFGRVGARVDIVDHLVLDQFLTGRTEHDVHATAGLLVGF
jgi:opacity protein-like surface antigen